MPAISEADVQTQIKGVIQIFEYARKFASVTSTYNWIDLETTLITNFTGDFVSQLSSALSGARSTLNSLLLSARNCLDPLLRTYAQTLGVPETDSQSALTRIKDDYITNNKRITSRLFVFGSPAAGSNTGNGTIYRYNIDEDSLMIENQTPDSKVAECVFDSTSGVEKHEEVFEFRGGTAAKDILRISGSGRKARIAAISARDSLNFIKNPSFSQSTPSGVTASPTEITNWTSDITVNGTNYETVGGATATEGTEIYRKIPGETTPLALRCKANAFVLSQNIEYPNRAKFNRNTPVFFQVAFRRILSADGTLTIQLGSKTASATISSISNNAWGTLRLGLTTNENWYKNFNQAALTVKIQRSGGSAGSVDIDDVLLCEMDNFDGSWYSVVGGTTQFKIKDKFSWTDNEYSSTYSGIGANGQIQSWIWKMYGRYLPSIPTAPVSGVTAVDGGAGAMAAGTYKYKVSFVDANGIESNLNATETSITQGASKQVSLSAIPTGTATGITKRKIYRTTSVGSTFKLLTTINDNSTTTYADNTVDASLGADAGTQQTMFADPV